MVSTILLKNPFPFQFRVGIEGVKWGVALIITVTATLIAPFLETAHAPSTGTSPTTCEMKVAHTRADTDRGVIPPPTSIRAIKRNPGGKRARRGATLATTANPRIQQPAQTTPARATRHYRCTAQDVMLRRCDAGTPLTKKVG
jgi:hypothetical protein